MNQPTNQPAFGDYLVFVDESGDHGLQGVSSDYPVFVLLFVIVHKEAYSSHVCPELQRFKFHFWGHDEVVLHEHEIRKPREHFLILRQPETRQQFLDRLTRFMESAPVAVVAIIIDKPRYAAQYHVPVNPYEYAMEAGLERVFRHLDP